MLKTVLLGGAILFIAPPAFAQDDKCHGLMALQLPSVRVVSAQPVAADGDARAYCKFIGVAEKEIVFEVDMPMAGTWNGKFLMGGSGGFLGNLQNGVKPVALLKGYATAVTDTGHPIPADGGGSWAYRNPERVVNFGYRGTHVAAGNAKLVVEAYYGRSAARSYFFGSSGSGRQAMMEAQRYPLDFEGIVAACPAFAWTKLNVLATGWTQQNMYPTLQAQYEFKPVVPPEKVASLDDAVYEKCDGADGLKDGIITNPLACKFDPKVDLRRCEAGRDKADCFTDRQVDVIARIHDGPVNSHGRLWAGWAYGGEAIPGMWTAPAGRTAYVIGSLKSSAPYSSRHYLLTNETLRYLVFSDPDYDLHSFNFETDTPALTMASAQIDADDPDLSGFARRGGKLIMSVGWSDWAVDGLGVKAYYDAAAGRAGGAGKLARFARLFMLPGVGHCFATDPRRKTPGTVDLLGALEKWVEQGIAPDSIVASHIAGDAGSGARGLSMPITGTVDRTRPICAYPKSAVYGGHGSPDDARNFACRAL